MERRRRVWSISVEVALGVGFIASMFSVLAHVENM
jgi:hypothetical protein